MARTVVLNLLFLLIGLLIGRYLLVPGVQAPAAPKLGGTVRKPVVQGVQEPERPVRSPQTASRGDAGRRGWEDLSRVIAAVRPEPKQESDGVVTGEVKTTAGSPLSGVTVTLIPRKVPEVDDPRWPKKGLEREVLNFIAAKKWRKVLKRQVQTGPDGTFRIAGLPADSTYSVTAELPGYRIRTESRRQAWAVQPGNHVVFIAEPVAEIPVKVLLPDGSQPERASITIQAGGNSREIHWKPTDSAVRVDPGVLTLYATANVEEQQYRSKEVTIKVEPGVQQEPLVFQLHAESGISGKVIFDGVKGPDVVQVFCVPGTRSGKLDKSRLRGLSFKFRSLASVESDYAFKFTGLKPGTYHLVVFWSDTERIAAEALVEVGEGMSTCNLRVPPPDPGTYLVLWVYDPFGNPVSRVSVSVEMETRHTSSRRGATLLPQEDGSFWVLWPEFEIDSRGTMESVSYTLIVESPAYGRQEVEVDPARDREVTVRFVEPAMLTVKLEGTEQLDPSVRLRVMVTRPGEGRGPFSAVAVKEQSADSSGVAKIGPLAPGVYEVKVVLQEEVGFGRTLLSSATVTLASGENNVTLSLAPLSDLVVFVPENVKRLRLKAQGKRWYYRSAKVDSEGKVVFKRLTPGTYQLISDGLQGGIMTVEVPTGGPVRFEPKPINALRVRIDDPEGLFAKAGFRTGDLIVGVNGKEFRNQLDFQALIAGAMAKQKAEMIVLRDGRRITIAFPIKALMGEEGRPGGDFEPATRP